MSHDPLCEFFWAFLLIFLLNVSRTVSFVIQGFWRFAAREFKK